MVSMSDAVRTYVTATRDWSRWFQLVWLICFALLVALSVQCASGGRHCRLAVAVIAGIVLLQVVVNITAMIVVHMQYNARVKGKGKGKGTNGAQDDESEE